MQEKDVEQLIKRRDKVNTQIEMIEQQNKETQSKINELILELNSDGVDVNLENINNVLSKYEDIYNKEYTELKLAVEKAEREIGYGF